MTDEELEEIEQRCLRARKGPWKSFIEGRDHVSGCSFIRVDNDANPDDDIELTGATDADQDFIAHARTDIPKLVTAIRTLKKHG